MKTTALVCVMLALVGVGIPVAGHAQTNSWSSPTRGYWDDYQKWSLGITPTNSQSVYITNDVSKTVTIDSYTSEDRPDTMTVSNLSLFAPLGVTNTLELFEAGTNLPLCVVDTFSLSAGGWLRLTESAVWMLDTFSLSAGGLVHLTESAEWTQAVTNTITNAVLNVDGVVVLNNNGLLMADTGLYVGVDTNATGLVLLNGGGLFLTNRLSSIGVNGSGQMIISNGTVQASAYVLVGSGSGSQGALTVAGGNYISSAYSRLAVGMETGAVGVVSVTAGNLVRSNAFLTLVGGDGSGQLNLLGGTNILGPVEVGGDSGSRGTLTVAGGVNDIQGALLVGASIGATGAVWMTGGQLLATNWPTYVGYFGVGQLTVSNGTLLARSLTLTSGAESAGRLTAAGGTIMVSSNIVMGSCGSNTAASFEINGGAVFVTNATHNAVVEVRNGTMTLSGGLLVIDKLVLNSPCGHFQHTGGTLLVGDLVLNPAFSATGDGLPNAWKQAYGLDPLSTLGNNGPDGDPDGDGRSNLQEYLDGTDPTNATSALRIISTTPEGNDIRVTWTTVGGKAYLLQTITNAGGGSSSNFIDLATIFVGGVGESTTNYLDIGGATNSPPRDYRVEVLAASRQTSVVGWGYNNYGQATPPAGLSNVVAIAAGYSHSLALKSDGTVVGWGYNTYAQATPPVGICVVAVAAGGYHNLALKSDGTVVGRGTSGSGQATPPSGLSNVVAVAAGGSHSLALKSDGTVVGWGYSGSGQATPPAGLSNVVAIAAGYRHSLALKSDGTVVGWGDNSYGQGTPPVGLSNVVAIAAGGYHSLALKSDGTVVGWGDNDFGQATTPAGLSNVVAIAAGFYHSLALKSDGTVVGWGDNGNGEATPPVGLTGVIGIAAGDQDSLAITSAPQAPTNLTATAVSSTEIDLSWTAGGSGTEAWFGIERATSSTGPWNEIATVNSNVTEYSDTGVTCGQTYFYRVRAYNGAASPYSGTASANTSPQDTDCDGIPNAWMLQYFGHPTGQASDHSMATDDADGDGMSNLWEYQAGTNPTNSASAFRIIEVRPDGADMLITWTAVGGNWYVLQTTTGYSGCFSNNFIDLDSASRAPGSGETEMTVLHLGAATNAPSRYYRVRLVP